MKKAHLFGLILLYTCVSAQAENKSAVEKNSILQEQIIGEWTCRINYPDMELHTLDILEFQADGSSVGIGYFFFTDLLAYETKHTGKWTLKENILSEVGHDYRTVKIHSDKTSKRIAEDKEFREFEEKFYQQLSAENNSGATVNLEIQQLTDSTMQFEQILGNRRYVGNCKKNETSNG